MNDGPDVSPAGTYDGGDIVIITQEHPTTPTSTSSTGGSSTLPRSFKGHNIPRAGDELVAAEKAAYDKDAPAAFSQVRYPLQASL